jgi:hypothetical protein
MSSTDYLSVHEGLVLHKTLHKGDSVWTSLFTEYIILASRINRGEVEAAFVRAVDKLKSETKTRLEKTIDLIKQVLTLNCMSHSELIETLEQDYLKASLGAVLRNVLGEGPTDSDLRLDNNLEDNLRVLVAFSKELRVEIGVYVQSYRTNIERIEVLCSQPGGVIINVLIKHTREGREISILRHTALNDAVGSSQPSLTVYPFVCKANTEEEYRLSVVELDDPTCIRTQRYSEPVICQRCSTARPSQNMFGSKCCGLCNDCMLQLTSRAACPTCMRSFNADELAMIASLEASVAPSQDELDTTASSIDKSIDKKNPAAKKEEIKLAEVPETYDPKLCKICYDNACSEAFMPCGHVVCSQCATKITKCPFCKARVTQILRIHL